MSGPLVCNCTIRIVETSTGEIKSVRSRRWDCPSCGSDKAGKIREMCVEAGSYRMFTLTFTQPRYLPEGPPPERHRECLVATHVYVYRDGTQRWRMLETCSHCCAYASWCWAKFRKALRRRYPDFQALQVREIQPRSGSFTLNVAVVGLPPVKRKSRAGRRIVEAAIRSGFGTQIDLGHAEPKHSPGALGHYIGKYLTKLAHRGLAKGYRRWSRTARFAPWVLMAEPRTPTGLEYVFLGYAHPTDPGDGPTHPSRWYPPD